uniref:Amino acid transporter transmembrane domain-containing protein n=1 Tax=Alexandrium monilatum TaxID=311494 RepID=A0A7S4Q5T7_9DINO
MAVGSGLGLPLLTAADVKHPCGPAVDPEKGQHAADVATGEEALALAEAASKDEQRTMTIPEATFAMANFVLNFGMFSVPMAFARTGWAAIGIIVLVGGLCLVNGLLLGRVFERLQAAGIPRPTYSDASLVAAGPCFAALITCTCYLEVATYGWGNLVVLSRSLAQLAPGVDPACFVAGSSLLALMLSGIPDRAYAYVSLVSALSIIMACSTVIASGWVLPAWARAGQVFQGVGALPLAFSLVIFGPAAHPCLSVVFHGTGSRSDFDAAVRNGWILWTVTAIGFGAGTYYIFGDAVQVLALQNIGHDLDGRPLPGAECLGTFATAWMVLKSQGALVPNSRPFVHVLARVTGVKLGQGNGGAACVLLSLPVITILGVGAVLLEDHIGALEAASGSLLMTTNAVVFPIVVYVLICKPASA